MPKKSRSKREFEKALDRLDAPDDRVEVKNLLSNIKAEMPSLQKLFEDWNECSEDLIYRFYHQSFKAYALQQGTLEIVAKLQSLLPNTPLNNWFNQIIHKGTGKTFEMKDNSRWLYETRPILEAFFHARYFLQMAIKYGKELNEPPNLLPSGWAGLLYLYNLR
jgi:hypothetical protein